MAVHLEGAEKRPVESDACAVLLPDVEHLRVDAWVRSFLRSGGRAVALGLSSDEYAERSASRTRMHHESRHGVRAFSAEARATAGGPVLIAVEAESGGLQRFKHLLPTMPTSREALQLSDSELQSAFDSYARAADDLGVTMFLGPVLDMVTGTNPWLHGRGMIDDHARTASTGALFATAARDAGIIAAAKYFPGHPVLQTDPAETAVRLTIDQDEVVHNLVPFRALVRSGVRAIVLGPVIATAIDPEAAAPTSTVVVDLLRRELGFQGLVISDHLDVPSTTLGRSLPEVAVAAVAAGVQLLRIPGGQAVADVARSLVIAVHDGRLSRSRLARAADAVRRETSRLRGNADVAGTTPVVAHR